MAIRAAAAGRPDWMDVGYIGGKDYSRNQKLSTGSATLSTAYDNADIHRVYAYLGHLASNGFILNKDSIENIYVWISLDGETFYDSDIGLDVDYKPVLPGTGYTLSPRTAHSIKIGGSGNSIDYAIALI